MAGFADREEKRAASIVAGMISSQPEEKQDTREDSAVKRNTTLYMRDDIINDAKAIAFIKKVSLSNIAEKALLDYIDANRELLDMYKKIFESS